MTFAQKRAVLILFPWTLCNFAWGTSYVWEVRCVVVSGTAAAIAQSMRGDVQFEIWTDPAGRADRGDVRVARVDPFEENSYGGREWTFAGFGFSWDAPDKWNRQARNYLVGFPYWFVSLGLLYVSAWLIGLLGTRRPVLS